jgi:hypothetical protein
MDAKDMDLNHSELCMQERMHASAAPCGLCMSACSATGRLRQHGVGGQVRCALFNLHVCAT